MSSAGPAKDLATSSSIDRSGLDVIAGVNAREQVVRSERHLLFRTIWYGANLLLVFAVFLVVYSMAWEYSTRRYLKGFSDAIVPASASPEVKIDAILSWMSNGPARRISGPREAGSDRDPIDALNYASLLRVCGTATNAFVNLADSAGLAARRLLLLDSHRRAKHVVAEVLVDGRWIVVDPAFRSVLRGADRRPLTRRDLVDPAVLARATRSIPDYDPDYSYESTAHVRLSRLPVIGGLLRIILNRLVPGWEDSVGLSELLERDSLALLFASVLIASFLMVVRMCLRWYGEKHLGVHPIYLRTQLRRVVMTLLDPTG